MNTIFSRRQRNKGQFCWKDNGNLMSLVMGSYFSLVTGCGGGVRVTDSDVNLKLGSFASHAKSLCKEG